MFPLVILQIQLSVVLTIMEIGPSCVPILLPITEVKKHSVGIKGDYFFGIFSLLFEPF